MKVSKFLVISVTSKQITGIVWSPISNPNMKASREYERVYRLPHQILAVFINDVMSHNTTQQDTRN